VVELLQIRQRHTHVARRRRLLRLGQRRRHRGSLPAADAQQDRLHVEAGRAATTLDRLLHRVEGMLVEQVQDADVVLHAAPRTVLPLQGDPEFVEDGRQMPASKHVGMVQCRRPASQGVQVMPRIEDLLVFVIRTRVRGNHLAAQHHVHTLDVGLDRHRLEGGAARHAVTIGVQANHLVLVHLGRLRQARIEGNPGE
jgi:hypothetical protein